MISVDSAERRYARSNSDLPDHDLILELSDPPGSLACHARHYVNNDVHVVIVGQLNGGVSPIASAASVAREVAGTVIPPEGEFTMIAYTPWKRADHRLHGMLHASLLSALNCCSMVVIPYDGQAIMQGVQAAVALQYTLEHPDVPAVIAHDRAEARDFVRHKRFGVQIANVGDDLPRDVSAVTAAVDRSCAAYECLQADQSRSLVGLTSISESLCFGTPRETIAKTT